MISSWTPRTGGTAVTLRELDEQQILAAITDEQAFAQADVGPGDDAGVLPASGGRTVVTTDSMVLDLDWRDDWSSAHDVGRKVVAQNIADVLAMGATPTGIVVALATEDATRLDWVRELTQGMSAELRRVGTGVLGGDLSGLPAGVLITVTALGELAPGDEPMLRANARVGDCLVVSDPVGRSHAGLLWLTDAAPGAQPGSAAVEECVAFHRAPWPRYAAAAEARAAGMTCLMDVSDGLVKDAGRIAAASSVRLDLDGAVLREMSRPFQEVVGDRALECVLGGGEEHALLGTCRPGGVPAGWYVVGQVRDGRGVFLDGAPAQVRGWDHFGR